MASSDATNLKNTTAAVQGNKITLNGHKWVCRISHRVITRCHRETDQEVDFRRW